MVNILNSLDILAVQEHWLTKQNLPFLNSVHSNFKARGIASIDYGDGLSGRPHGGFCFLWRRSHCFSPLMLLHIMLVMRTAQGADSTTCSPPTLVTHQYLIWKLNMIVSLPTTYLYAFLYMSSYYIPLKPPYRCKFKHLVMCGMLPPQDLHNYHTQTGLLLSAIYVPHEVLRCTNPNCNEEAHRTLLSNLYNDIIKSLKDAAEVIPTKANNTSSKYTVLA